jgi:hypothetical protein
MPVFGTHSCTVDAVTEASELDDGQPAQLIWARPVIWARPGKPRRQRPTRAAIVAAAITLADAEGGLRR